MISINVQNDFVHCLVYCIDIVSIVRIEIIIIFYLIVLLNELLSMFSHLLLFVVGSFHARVLLTIGIFCGLRCLVSLF